jgi:DNA-binding transcriptional ArsR family regulator
MKKMKSGSYAKRASIAKALAHPSRLILLDALSEKDLCVCELNKFIEADQSTISKHLAVLKNAGLVSDKKKGLNVYYSLIAPCVLKFFECTEQLPGKCEYQ